MANRHHIELPLYNAFLELIKLEKGQPNKGIDPGSYLQLIDVLHKGYGLNSKEELIFFCKKLWLKPFHTGDATITEQVLETVLLNNLRTYEAILPKQEAQHEAVPAETKENAGDADTEVAEQPEAIEADEPEEEEEETPQPPAADYPTQTTERKTKLIINIENVPASSSFDKLDYSDCFNDKIFKFNYTYLAVSPRFIEQTIRSLRYKVKGTGKPVIDIKATVKDVSIKGYFDKWLFDEEDDFVTRWTLLFDRGGSMVAFHGLQDALAEAVLKGTIKNEGDLFYFKNIVRNILFTTRDQTHAVQFNTIAQGPRRNILIVSDAGAARGSFNEDRVQDTYSMMYHLRKHRVAWLNPLPKERWKNSSASIIAQFVNMFQPGHDYSDDLGNIVRLFKSKIITTIRS